MRINAETRGELRILKIFLWTRWATDANLQTRIHCIANVDYLPTPSLERQLG